MGDTTTTHFRTCPLCEATCGLEITMRGAEVGRIRGDRDDVFSHGFICPKGSTLKQLHDDPDRLRAPVIRRGDDPASAVYETVSWDEAFAEVERLLVPVLEAQGRTAAAVYLGNPNVHVLASPLYTRALVKALGTPNVFSASTVDQMPKHVACGLLFGAPLSMPVPDLDRTDFLLMLGANPLESNGSLCTAPDFPGRLDAIRARGGRIVVVDPRRTRTAGVADEHLRIRPGSDGHLLLAMAHVLFAEARVRLGDIAEHVSGLEELRAAVAPFTPEVAAAATGIDAATITRLARELAAAPSAAVYARIGANTVEFGTLTQWAAEVLNVITGNLDRPGGAMFPLPAHQRRRTPGPGRGFVTARRRSRVGDHPEVMGEFPVAALADEILTPGPGRVRALITVAGNPLLSTPHSRRLDEALATLDCMVSVDPFRNETTRRAHVILPPPSPLARSHYDLAFSGLSVRNVANYSPAIVDTDGPPEHEILSRLALIVAGQGSTADPAIIDDLVLDGVLAGRDDAPEPEAVRAMLTGADGAERAIDAMLRLGEYGDRFGAVPDGLSLAKLMDNPHGIDFGALTPRIPEILKTPTGTVELAPAPILEDLPRLVAALDRPANGTLVMIGRRHLRSNNSWMHNVNVLVKGKPRCTLQVHPDDAARLGLTDGDSATVSSSVGSVVAPVEVTDEVMAGVVSLPHGWGHDLPGTSMAVAEAHAGVNVNVLTDSAALDPLSGTAVLTGFPVTVQPA